MFNTTKRVFALLLAVALVFSLAGCKKTKSDGDKANDEGSSVIIETVTQTVVTSKESSNDEDTDATESTGSKTSKPQTSKPKTSKPKPSKPSSNPSGSGDKTPSGKVNPDDYKGTVVKFASTIDPASDGTDYVVKNFEKKYDIDVQIVACSLPGYIQEMQGLIANGTSPDVGRSNGDFPACVAYFDSLDKAKIDYKDPIWNQNTFKISTFNGSPYMCDTLGCYWTELDIVIYSKKLLKAAGCPTPQELDKNGNWTWDSFMMIAEECTKKQGTPAGCINTNELALHMAGGNVFKVENEKIVNGLDAKSTAVIKKFAEAWKKGILNAQSTVGIVEGTTAIGTGHAWSLRKDGDIAKGSVADYGFYYLPSYEKGGARPATGLLRGFGIMRGAKNPVGGGLFLRWYLDVNNYDTKNAFINEDAKNFFFELTTQDYAEGYNPYLTYIGLNQDIAGLNYGQDVYAVMKMDPSAVDGKMASVKAAVDKGAKNLNKHINDYIYSN